jgi:hypothetical protein
MRKFEVWATARLLIAQHGTAALPLAESHAIGDLLCGDAEGSADWERVSDAVKAMLAEIPAAPSRWRRQSLIKDPSHRADGKGTASGTVNARPAGSATTATTTASALGS